MKLRQKLKISVLLMAISFPMTAMSALCPVTPASTSMSTFFTNAKRDIKKDFKNTDEAISDALKTRSDKLLQALKVYNMQKSASANELGLQMAKNTQLIMEVEHGIKMGEQIAEATEEYSARGLGYNICDVLAKQKAVNHTSEKTNKNVARMTNNEVSARAGRYYPRTNSMAMRLAVHEELYCTPDQKASGLCAKVGRRAGKSLEAGTLFTKSKVGSDEYNDKSALIDNIIGFPDDPVPSRQLDTVVGVAYQDIKRRKDAGKSIASYSLKYLQARYSELTDEHDHHHDDRHGHNHSHNELQSEQERLAVAKDAKKATDPTVSSQNTNNMAFMPMFMADQERYFGGGNDYKEWSKYLVGATEKGVLQEQIKIEALNLKAIHEELKLNHLIEANISALISAELYNSGAETDVEKLRRTISVNNMGNIKSN